MNKSILCANILLLTPLSLAISVTDFQYDIGVGQKCVTIGDPTNAKTNIFGTQQNEQVATLDNNGRLSYDEVNNTFALNGSGLSRSVGYCSPVVTGALGFKATDNFILSTEVHVSSSDNIVINDVVSDVSNVFYALNAHSDNGAIEISELAITDTTGGRNNLSVEPKVGFSFKAEYQFGANANGAKLGLAVVRSADEFTYNADAVNEIRAVEQVASGVGGDLLNPEDGWKLVNNGAEKYDEAGFWIGAIASASAEINDSIMLKAGAGYYMRDFDASKNDSNGVKFLVRNTEATMSMFSVSVTVST